MSTACSVCRHPSAGSIDEALRSGHTARTVAAEYQLSYDAVTRHARNHLARRTAEPSPGADDPLDELVSTLRARALAGDPAVAREYRLALAAQTAARHATAPQPDLTASAEWLQLRATILEALEPFPAARLAVAAALA